MRRSQKGRVITWGAKISAALKGRPRKRRPLSERFWGKVIPGEPSECWLWRGAIDTTGYGVLGSGDVRAHKLYAHRVSHELNKGPIPVGEEIMHSCDNRACVNPMHLSTGTRWANVHDALRKGRMHHWNAGKTHCIRGHEFTPENTYQTLKQRACRTCTNERARRYREQRRAAQA